MNTPADAIVRRDRFSFGAASAEGVGACAAIYGPHAPFIPEHHPLPAAGDIGGGDIDLLTVEDQLFPAEQISGNVPPVSGIAHGPHIGGQMVPDLPGHAGGGEQELPYRD